MPPVRRLTAILAADVAGYSRLMGADEEGTHERLRAHLQELINPKIAEHRGRIVKNTGDGLLAEFASVVDAVRCAVEIQRGMIDREPEVPDERRISFRVGINLGDVIAEDHNIFGDGVNVAARVAIGAFCASSSLLGLALRRLPGIYRRGIVRGCGDRTARLGSGRRSHKQDQLNSNGIPRFLDFFSRLR
jgi:class 3 adenylate cyclase